MAAVHSFEVSPESDLSGSFDFLDTAVVVSSLHSLFAVELE